MANLQRRKLVVDNFRQRTQQFRALRQIDESVTDNNNLWSTISCKDDKNTHYVNGIRHSHFACAGEFLLDMLLSMDLAI